MGLFARGGPPRLYNNTHHLSSSAPRGRRQPPERPRGQGENYSAIEDIIYKLTGVRCKINGHRVALFFALLLFVFQVVAVQPVYTHWARIKKEVDHPIDCSELDCYQYDDYEVSYGLFEAREAEGEIGQEPATEESVAIEMEPTTMREQEELEPEC